MASRLDELVQQLALERIGENLFRGQSKDLGWGTVFGGQVVGQAISAALKTVPSERHVHSLQAYFLRPGDVSEPIEYEVERIREGSSFTTRRVVAMQAGRPIFHLAASFQKLEAGVEHQAPMPSAPEPTSLPTEGEYLARFGDKVPAWARSADRAFEVRVIDPPDDPVRPSPQPPKRQTWLRAASTLPDDPALHASLLAYVSDFSFVTTALQPHGLTLQTPGVQVASLDHVMWFHRRVRVDEWLLYDMDSPAAHGARGFVRGSFFDRSGSLVVSTAQEGLIRRRDERSR